MRGVLEDLGRCIGTIFISGLIIAVLIHCGPCGIERPIKIEWIIDHFPVVCRCFFFVSLPLILLAFFFSSLFLGIGLLSTKISYLTNPIKVFSILISAFPVFVAGIWISRIPDYWPVVEIWISRTAHYWHVAEIWISRTVQYWHIVGIWISRTEPYWYFIMAGLILGICDVFFIELYRHTTIEINTVKNEPYILMAKANGLKGIKLIWYIKNDIIIHLSKIFTSKLILLISSAVVVEYIFDIKGVGNLIIKAAEKKEIEHLICIEIFIVIFVLLCSFGNRIIDRLLDPRLKEE